MIVLRNPVEVAASLEQRNGITRERALLLWLKYNLEAERNTRGLPRAFVHYPDVLADWKTALRHVAKRTGCVWPRSYEAAEARVAEFIRPELKHQEAAEMQAAFGVLSPWMQRTFQALKDGCRGSGEVDTAVLDSVWRDFSAINVPLQEEIDRLREINAKQAEDIQTFRKHLELMQGSTSWRVTSPLRRVKCVARHLGKKEKTDMRTGT